jgi:hypothetical protein
LNVKSNIPDVFVIGFSKCGTTSLYEYFSRHKDIYVPDKKELHYHSYPSLKNFIGGSGDKFVVKDVCKKEDEYLQHYKLAGKTQVKIDISPSYVFFPSSISSIIALCGSSAKIICLVKHPVDKIISQYTHLLSAGRETLSLEQALKIENNRKDKSFSDMWLYKESGYMVEKIKEFKNNFKSVFVINAEDLYKSPVETLNDLFHFLNVDKTNTETYESIVKNFSGVPKSLLVSKIFIQPNFFTSSLRSIVPQKWGKYVRQKINNFNKGEKYIINTSLYESLENEFYDEIKELNSLIDTNTKIRFKYSK